MADDSANKTISSTQSGFPEYLDFNKLRSDAIAYLGNLSGKIWTDHNVHDPGITILEVLVYAVLDLGYRTSLPAADLFARSPDDKSADNNFFTPAQILSNNPLTITDYRKLLIDIEGVKNAWLEIDKDTSADFCSVPSEQVPGRDNNFNTDNRNAEEEICACNLNGLYHVYVQLEKDFELTDRNQKDEYNNLIEKIKCTLMQHRNLCEDFIDIKVLCKTQIGLCADIELEADANGEEAYLQMIEALQGFFSPAPKFYTLPQLLEKGKLIEEIFAGRPYDIKESHGFVDTEEFEQIKLRREIYFSDVYHVLLNVKGVKNVRRLAWKVCDENTWQTSVWKLILPENNIPEFDPLCSSFSFFKYGMAVKVDQKKYESFLNYTSNGKILYTQPSLNLDAEIPKGTYRSELADYYSIQNEFPHVYGIGVGDLSNNETDERKAKALQLQGFLLLFDQLLANYLMQLKNVRSLFAFSSSAAEEDNHTYFINQLTNVPQLQKLLRFKTDEDSEGTQGNSGSILAYPTKRSDFENLINSGKIKNTDLEDRCSENDFPPYRFCFGAERDQAVTQLREDILYGGYEAVITSNNDDCFFFYLFTSSTEFVLISKRYYKNEQEAKNAAASVKYAASFENNYRSFITADCENNSQCFSFDIELTLDTYAGYLKVIVEDENLYLTRRQSFLNHLLSRFAEQFTDFALLSSKFLTATDLQKAQIKAEEKFLTNYDVLSSNRGKAYNYLCNGWENENTSGFEKRFKALAGIEDWRKHYLCNFVVEEIDKLYVPEVEIGNNEKLTLQTPLNKADALASVNSLYKKLNSDAFFEMKELEYENDWQLFTRDELNNKYFYSKLYKTKEEAENQQQNLQNIFFHTPDKQRNLLVVQHIYKAELMHAGEVLAEYAGNDKNELTEKAKAEAKCTELSADINSNLKNEKIFKWNDGKKDIGNLVAIATEQTPFTYINEKAFQPYFLENVNLTEDVKYTYTFRDVNKKILFESATKFNTEPEAEDAFKKILPLLAVTSAYYVQKNTAGNDFGIFIKTDDSNIVHYFKLFSSEADAKTKINEIVENINAYTYSLNVSEPVPFKWKFQFLLTSNENKKFIFQSKDLYSTEEVAFESAKRFYADIPNLQLKISRNELSLESPTQKTKSIWINNENTEDKNAVKKEADPVLKFHQSLIKSTGAITEEQSIQKLKNWQINKTENYIYKLVDKDNLLAEHTSQKKIFTQTDADDIRNKLFHTVYDYVDINTGGSDIFCSYEDAQTKSRWYHYQIKCTNRFHTQGNFSGKELVLFQSVKGYASKEEALNAFNKNLFIILKYAHAKENYGDGKFISLKEFALHTDDACDKTESIVCVPRQTTEELGGYEIQNKIIPLVKSYPIKYITEERFRFSLYNNENDFYDWRSGSYYQTAQQAMQQFQFFLMLLKYAGNFYIQEDKTDCRFHIYIREVLAQSIRGFNTCQDAWDGIEKFICISQTDEGFHNYFKQMDCSHSFFVACGNTGLIHPCKYETPERRDDVLNRLYNASSFNFFELLQTDEKNNLVLLNLEKEPIAKIYFERQQGNYSNCENLIKLFELIYNDKNYKANENKIYLQDENENRIAESISSEITLEKWKTQLLSGACYFPILRKAADDKQACNYYVQIKLPGFDACTEIITENFSVRECNDECKPGCYIAWKSDCCFNSCCEALRFYIASLRLLRNYEYYKRVYECNCQYYTIELHQEYILNKDVQLRSFENNSAAEIQRLLCSDFRNAGYVYENNQAYRNINRCINEIVAFNPQQYTNGEIACEAVERAKKLINSEGLHLVEHILLRPHCINVNGVYEECSCDALPKPCIDYDNICRFPWKPGGAEDPCAENKKICFTPGCDPYSFIATVALPAWPQRFRSKENKAVIEKLLQKEAPAHVLLRILWLNPRDFCCFEYEFKNWNYWLAKKLCAPYNNCDFLQLLFAKYFKPLRECEDCVPCTCDNDEPVSCFEKGEDDCNDFNLSLTINELFCWNNYKREYDFSNCEPCNCIEENKQTPGDEEIVLKKAKKKSSTALLKDVEHRAQLAATEKPEPVTTTPSHQKVKRIQARAYAYNENVKKVREANPENKVAENAQRFLSDVNPTPKRFDDLINQVLKDKSDKTKNIKALTFKQKQTLIQNIIWQYLDRLCFNKKETSIITEHAFLFNHLRKNKIDMEALYDGWNSKEVKQLEPEANVKEIKKALT